jgi:hypothetical protein
MALLLSGSVFAASTIDYSVELGGDPHVTDWENFLNTPYTAGSTDPGYTVSPGANGCILNWAVRVATSGTVSDGMAGEVPVYGVANVVWTLEVRDSNGDLVAALDQGSPTETGWFSVINDGDADGPRGLFGADPLQLAAFAVAFDVNGGGATGRIFDLPDNDGPYFERYQYPSTEGFPCVGAPPVCATADGGTLVGMGAGYAQYKGLLLGGSQRSGVGLTAAAGDCDSFLGPGPVGEGQINLDNIPSGTYTLHVVPGNGNNVLRGDFICIAGTDGAFAVAADTVNPDSIDFVVDGCGVPAGCTTAPTITSAVSRKAHGGAGSFDIDILPGTATEDRIGGTTQVVVGFDMPVAAADGTLDGNEIVLSSGTVSSATIDGSTLTINMSGATNLSCLLITLNGISCTPDPELSGIMLPAVLKVRQLYGDANGDGQVASGDITQVKSSSGQVTNGTNFRRDVNADGQVASGDITIVKSRSGNVALVCPP